MLFYRAVDPHGLMAPRRRSMSRTSHRGGGGGGGVDGLASVHENDGGSTDDSDDESDSVGNTFTCDVYRESVLQFFFFF